MRQPINVWVLIRSDTLPDHYAEPERLRQQLCQLLSTNVESL